MSTSFVRALAAFEIPSTLDQRLRRNRGTRRAARLASWCHGGAWIAGLTALAAIVSAGAITAR